MEKYTKGRPVEDKHFDDCRKKWEKREIPKNSWILTIEEIKKRSYDLTAENLNRKDDISHKAPIEIIENILTHTRKLKNG